MRAAPAPRLRGVRRRQETALAVAALRAVEACAAGATRRSPTAGSTDRGAVHALNILSCKEGGGAGGGFYGTEMKLEVSGDAKLSF